MTWRRRKECPRCKERGSEERGRLEERRRTEREVEIWGDGEIEKEQERGGEREADTHRLTVEAARLIGQGSLEDVVHPRRLRLVLRLRLRGDGGPVVFQASVLFLLLLLVLQYVGHRVQQVVEELVGVLLHVVIKQVCRGRQRRIRPAGGPAQRKC